MTDTRERGKVDFQEVAKLAATPQPSPSSAEDTKENSGIIHLSALSPGDVATTEKAEALPPRAAPPVVPHTPSPSARKASEGLPAAVRQASAPAVAPTAAVALSALRSRSTFWVALASGMALGALMAGVLFALHISKSAQASRIAGTPMASQASQGGTLVQNAPAQETRAATHGSTAQDQPVPSPLPAAPAGEPARASVSSASRPSSGAGTPPAAASTSSARAAVTASAASPTASGAGPRPGTDESLEALMKRAAGGSDSAAPPGQPAGAGAAEAPAAAAGSLPVKPALGAVQGALGTVMPAARYCLGPDDPVSRATITFRSDGSVESVAVTGDAAGQPAEGCIRSRLMAARVPPFASPTFTWTITVRPAN